MSTKNRNLRLKNLATGLSAALALAGLQSAALAQPQPTSRGNPPARVLFATSCEDDNSAGTLRQVVADAANGDEINLSELACTDNTIVLTQGELMLAHNASLVGSASQPLTITNGSGGRVINSVSQDRPYPYLDIANVNISGGTVLVDSGDALGGCIFASGDLTLTGSTVSGCMASSSSGSALGGAIYAQNVNMASSRVTGNAAYASGDFQPARGGAVHTGNFLCTDSTLSGNVATAKTAWSGQGGGAMVMGGSLALTRCTIDNNISAEGGGVSQFMYSESTSLIENSTISGNTATFAFGGVEVFCADCTATAVQLFNSTIAFNSSAEGYTAGLFSNANVLAQSSILAKNQNTTEGSSVNADLSATGLTGANNLVMSSDVAPDGTMIGITDLGPIISQDDPELLPLADNGGPTMTHALSETSPAMYAGNNVARFATDQRSAGFERSCDDATDIGAYQHQSD